MRDIRDAGQDAALAGRPSYANPHPRGTAAHCAWHDGWVMGVEMRERMTD